MLHRIREKLHQYSKWEPLAFFVGGFAFDALLLHRIDDPLMLIHQAVYLTLSALIIAWDLFEESGQANIPPWLNRMWAYREGILHFMLGTLLNVYTIFYFKSGSFMSSLYFLLLLALLLYLNEVRPARISKHFLRNALFNLCLISYLNILVSIAAGTVSPWAFFTAVVVAALVNMLFVRLLRPRIDGTRLWPEIRAPFLGMAAIYALLYVLKVLPPVPLSVKYMGIYREISRSGDVYKLGYQRSKWRFWERGDQTFHARPGEKIYCFAQIFSPTRFNDQLFVRWDYKDPRLGWRSWDAIPLKIVGGREEGYRGYTVKTNYQPGDWRVSIETADGREVGRIGLTVSPADPAEPTAPLQYDYR